MLRELMERTGLIEWLAAHFSDPRHPDRITHPMSELLRTALTLRSPKAAAASEASGLCRFTGSARASAHSLFSCFCMYSCAVRSI